MPSSVEGERNGIPGKSSLPLAAASSKEDDFAEFDDSEFDYEVNEPDEEVFVGGEEEEEELDVEDEMEGNDFDDLDENGENENEGEMDEDEFETPTTTPGKMGDIEIEPIEVMGPVWKNYSLEMVVIAGMVLYLANYFIGRYKNSSMAQAWFKAHMNTLSSNFTVVGDSGEGEEPTEGDLVKESDETFVIWCSGRVNCAGMMVHMQFFRRHDVISLVANIMQPKKNDVISLVFQLRDEDEMDSFVLAIGTKKTLQKMQKDYEDLNSYCPNIRPVNKVDNFCYISEMSEAAHMLLSERTLSFLTKHASTIQSIHISDQYTGFVQDSDDSETVIVRKPEKRIRFNFYASSFDQEGPHLKFALQLLDQVKNIRLSREARDKAVKNRASVRVSLDKLQHTQRQEAAQLRKEEKVRALKEKTMQLSETDPDKARKLEEKENKKARKKLQNKMKSVKVRAS